MSVKMVQIPAATHRRVAIEAAKRGVTIMSIVDEAIKRGLAAKKKRSRKVSAATSEGSQSGA